MNWLGLILLVAGFGLFSGGFARARGPWARYRALKTQEDNIARYEAWRGGLRDSGPTGASVAMEMLRKQVRDGVILGVAGVILGVGGLFML
jgi:hypothetical protein